MIIFLKLLVLSLIPLSFAVGFAFLERDTKFKDIKRFKKLLIVGLVFGFVSALTSLLSSLWGLNGVDAAAINVRDAAPIIAALMFGGPAGILAGFIGGVYRFVCVYWGEAGSFTQIACSVSTLFAGIFAALVRRFIFDNHHGKWYYGFFLGVLVEDFHMLLVFLTNMNNVKRAYEVVKSCALPMILVNSISIMLSLIAVALIFKEKLINTKGKMKVGTKVQLILLGNLVIAYVCTAVFSYASIKNTTLNETSTNIQHAINLMKTEVDENIDLTVGENLFFIRDKLVDDINDESTIHEKINRYIADYGISEINIIGKDNIVKYSNVAEYENKFNMDDPNNKQSREFTILNTDPSVDYFIQKITEPSSKLQGLTKYAGAKLYDINNKFGYMQIGYYEEPYYLLLDSFVSNVARHRNINQTGFLAITDETGNVFATLDGAKLKPGDVLDLKKLQLNKITEYTLKTPTESINYYAITNYLEGYYIIGMAEINECNIPTVIGFTGVTLTEIFVFLFLYGVLYVVIKRQVVDRLSNVSKGLNKITNGDLNVEINERKTLEFDSLSTDINKTVSTLKDFIAKEAQKNKEELEFAKNIQHSVLPTVFPLNDKFEIYALMNTAKEVGGDFYDFFYLDHEHVVIEIADVSGKGIPAAMFMMQAKTILKSLIGTGMDLGEAYTEANRRLCNGNDSQMFVTAWVGIINLSTGNVQFVNAGHNPPLIYHQNKKFEYLKSKVGFVLGGLEDFRYETQSFNIEPGDSIYLYTDGVTEAANGKKELFGEEKLLNVLNTCQNRNTRKICENVLQNVNEFVNGADQSDDITMLSFTLNGNESNNIFVSEAKIENIPAITEFIDTLLKENNCVEKARLQIDVAIDEIVSNICYYAYKPGELGKVKVTVDFDENKEFVSMVFEDRGIAYNPLTKEDPDANAGLEDRDIGGLGIFIVKQTMDSFEYENVNGHNVLTLKKRIK